MVTADVDGDGRSDRIYEINDVAAKDARRTDDESTFRLGVCTTTGKHDEVAVGGMNGYVRATDIEPDGRSDIISMGTAASAGFSTVYVFRGGRLREIKNRGQELILTDGYGDPVLKELMDWSCANAAGHAHRQLVQVQASWPKAKPPRWERRAYAVSDGIAVLVSKTSGSAPATPTERERWKVIHRLAGGVRQCA